MSLPSIHARSLKFGIIAVLALLMCGTFVWSRLHRVEPVPSVQVAENVHQFKARQPLLAVDRNITTLESAPGEDNEAFEVHYPSGQLKDNQNIEDVAFYGPRKPDVILDVPEIPTIAGQPATQFEVPPDIENDDKWRERSVDVAVPEGWKTVAIVIDDLGENRKYSFEAINLTPPMTMALLPYSHDVDNMAAKAIAHGHEVIIHMPMEPMNPDLDTGAIALKVDQTPEEFTDMLDHAFASMDGYLGVNNHMGSRLTQDQNAMNHLMYRLKKEGLVFLDSRTIPNSVAASTAAKYHVPYAVRDVFLDHDPSEEGVKKSFEALERVINQHGHAIAIGHPKEATVKVLREWVETLDEKKIKLVPISYSIKRRMKSDLEVQAALPQSGL